MPLAFRLRHSGGVKTLSEVPACAKLANLRQLIADETGVPVERQVLKVGVPPKPLPNISASSCLADAGLCDRDTILVEELPVAMGSDQSKQRHVVEMSVEAADSNVVTERSPATRQAKKRMADEMASSSRGVNLDTPESELLPAFDRAIAEATRHAKMLPEDKHQVFALRKGKAAVIESLKRGDNISLSALHTLRGVGHWVVQEVTRHLGEGPSRPTRGLGSGSKIAAPTPNSFTWWYLDCDGQPAMDRNSAEFSGSVGCELYRVCIMHSSGRIEKAWLPNSKAPPQSPGNPPST
mmetsp:Transcript_24769/g.65005  ORF Transcript_24769/g.65005 Transcript_24769/m.65005 type:complete len:295 (-) Transcript_24769:88-972(-)